MSLHDAAATSRNIRLTLEYDGRRYVGWQQQKDLPSVEATLLDAIAALTGEQITLSVAGRTDAGVHARGQVANFHSHTQIPARRLAPGLNAHLPADISVHEAEVVAAGFKARHDSLSKIYRYRVYRGPQPAALAGRAWHIRRPLDLQGMRSAASGLLGEHDFEAFRSSGCQAPHAVREFFAIDMRLTPRPPVGELVDIFFHANAFCRHMCRILTGTLVEVGMNKRTPQSVQAALESRDRAQAGVTAPPAGLTLMEVRYPA